MWKYHKLELYHDLPQAYEVIVFNNNVYSLVYIVQLDFMITFSVTIITALCQCIFSVKSFG